MKAAIYCRVSTEDQEKEGTSLHTQREACLAKARELGYEVPEDLTFIETYSGLTLDRVQLTTLRNRARNHEIEAIIVYTPDRLCRVGEDILYLAKEFKRNGVKLLFVREQWDDTLNGKLIAFILGWASEFEAAQIKERTMRGKLARVKGGRLHGGRSAKLYGYNYLPGKGVGEGVRYVNEEEAKWVREIYRWLVEEGLAINGIVTRLTALGVPSPSGNSRWHRGTIHKILTNVAYTGKTYAFRQSLVEAKRHTKDTRKYKATHVKLNPPEKWLEIPGATPTIISEETFQLAQAKLSQNKSLASRNAKRQYLLSGYVFCQRCGRRYSGGTGTRRGRDGIKYRRHYRCPNRSRVLSPTPCHNRLWNADYLEELVWGQIEDLLSKPEVVLAGLKTRENEAKQASSYLAELETVEVKLRHMEKEKDRVWKAFELTGDETKFTKQIKDVTVRVGELEKQKLELERRIEASKQAEVDMGSIKRFCELAKSNLADFTFENKRLALQALNIKVWVDGENITIEGAMPVAESDIVSTIS